MYFGMKNGLPTFQKVVAKTFKEYLDNFMKIFLDNFTIHNDMEIHCRSLDYAFRSARSTTSVETQKMHFYGIF